MLTVDGVAAAVVVGTVWTVPVTGRHWMWFTMLAVGSVVHLEAARGIERIREIDRESQGSPHTHLQSVWNFAGVLLLPPPLLAVLLVIGYGYAWVRVYLRHAALYKKVFAAATVVLGCAAALVVLTVTHRAPPGTSYATTLNSPVGLAGLVAAGFLYWLINYALVVGAILGADPDRPARKAFGHASEQLIIAASIGLGTGFAIAITVQPWAAPVLFATVLALHMGLLLPQFRAASETDRKTGLFNGTIWERLARGELERARRENHPVGILLIDLDHFKRINDTYGHLAGDDVLRAVAHTIRDAVRPYDAVGRFGGEELVVLLPKLDHDQVLASAERIRFCVGQLTVHTVNTAGDKIDVTVTVSIGAVVYPDHGKDFTDLMLSADQAMYEAKQTRNATVMGPRGPKAASPAAALPAARRPPG